MNKILVCDDDKDIVKIISVYLSNEGYSVVCAYNGKEALSILEQEEIHLIILDIMMPEMDGINTAMKVRESYAMPIIMLSAKSEDMDKIMGLNVGADDYLTKPFNPLELIARVKSQIRRYTLLGGKQMTNEQSVYKTGQLIVDDNRKFVEVDGKEVKLTPIEYKIILYLIKNAGRVYSSSQLYEEIWSGEAVGMDNIIAVHIRHIREKIEINPKEPRYLKVIWGIGYKIEEIKN